MQQNTIDTFALSPMQAVVATMNAGKKPQIPFLKLIPTAKSIFFFDYYTPICATVDELAHRHNEGTIWKMIHNNKQQQES
jgi:hypothetical protein